jgi:hypothetical protein
MEERLKISQKTHQQKIMVKTKKENVKMPLWYV